MPTNLQVAVGTYENLTLGYQLKQAESTKYDFVNRFTDHGQTGAVRCAAVSDGQVLATGSSDNSIKLFNLRKGVEIGTLCLHEDSINCLQFFKKWNMLSGSEDGTIIVWKVGKNWQCQRILRGHKKAVYSLSIHPTGRLALSCSKDKTLRMWNLMTGKCAYITNIKQVADIVMWSPDGGVYVVVTSSQIDVYSAKTSQVIYPIVAGFKISSVAFINTTILAVGGEGGLLQFYDIKNEMKRHELNTATIRIKSMTVVGESSEETNDKVQLVLASSDGYIKLYDVEIKASTVSCVLVAEVSTGFRLLSVAACNVDTKPTAVDLADALLTANDCKSSKSHLKESARKGALGKATVVIEKGSSSDEEEEDEDEDVLLVKKTDFLEDFDDSNDNDDDDSDNDDDSDSQDDKEDTRDNDDDSDSVQHGKSCLDLGLRDSSATSLATNNKKSDKTKSKSTEDRNVRIKKRQAPSLQVNSSSDNDSSSEDNDTRDNRRKVKSKKGIPQESSVSDDSEVTAIRTENKSKKKTNDAKSKGAELFSSREKFLHKTKSEVGKVTKTKKKKKFDVSKMKKADQLDLIRNGRPLKDFKK